MSATLQIRPSGNVEWGAVAAFTQKYGPATKTDLVSYENGFGATWKGADYHD